MMLPFPFSTEDIARFCEFLEESGQLERLTRFLWSLPRNVDKLESCEAVSVSRVVVALHNRDFHEVYRLIEGKAFSTKYHKKLQGVWYAARYAELESCKGRPLDAVAKYRVRRKYPAPRTICDGSEKSYCFEQGIRTTLNKAYERKPYPCMEEKQKLAEKTQLTVIQVSNWFKNKRQRIRITQQRKRETGKLWPMILNKTPYNYSCYQHKAPDILRPRYMQFLYNQSPVMQLAMRPTSLLYQSDIRATKATAGRWCIG